MKKLILLPFIFLLYSCSDKDEPKALSTAPIELQAPWRVSSAAEENIEDLSAILSKAAQLKRLTSVSVFRNGKQVAESYYKGYKKDSLHDVRSVTKSVMALLVGIALEKGFFKSINDPIDNYLPSSEFTLTGQQKKITLLHLLTMSGGFQWNETGANSYNEWILSGKPVDYLLEKPISNSPGTAYSYNSAAIHLLGVVLTKATAMSLPAFADEFLFSKIGITKVIWEQFDASQVNGGSGIRLRPYDMARIGQLMLQKGKSGTESIVSDEWIQSLTDPAYTWRDTYGTLTNYTYARLWWVQDAPVKSYFAWGFGGQFIYVFPEKNAIVITTTDWRRSIDAGGVVVIEQEAFDLVLNKILPKIK